MLYGFSVTTCVMCMLAPSAGSPVDARLAARTCDGTPRQLTLTLYID